VSVRIVPYTSRQADGARAFNARLTQAGAVSEFLLPESPPEGAGPNRAIRAVYYLALEDETVRGGFVLGDYPAWLNAAPITATVCIAPLSEGIIDPKYSMLSMQFVRFLRAHNPYGFAGGMGSPDNPYPRLLRAAGWTILPVPFFFLVCRAKRFLRHIAPLRRSQARRLIGGLAAWTGIGAAGISAGHARGLLARGYRAELSIETVTEWGAWADELWQGARAYFSFAISRDRRTLQDLYPASETRVIRFLVRRGERAVAWAAALDTQMRGDRYFGDLRVATILDCMGDPKNLIGAVGSVSAALREAGVDLIVSNQSHRLWRNAFRRNGFLEGPVNYCLGISKPIADHVQSHGGLAAIYFTRGDGDGRMHL
jgi:hypothetical protein